MERNDQPVMTHPTDQRETATTPSVTSKRPWQPPTIEQLALVGTGSSLGGGSDGALFS